MEGIYEKLFCQCKICNNDITADNFPILLSCEKTLCLNCHNKMVKNNSKCPFNKSHGHIGELVRKNYAFIDYIEKIRKQNLKPVRDIDKIIKPIENRETQNDKFIYEGPLKDNKPFGKGELIYKGIGIFKGEFNGEFHKGKGKIIYDDGSFYEGEWENFKRQNYGILKFNNLDSYEGEFVDDLYEGKGKFNLFDRNITYEGFWRNGKKFGEFNIYNEFGELIKKENYENDIKIS